MISKETMTDYRKPSIILYKSFNENLLKAKDLVVEDSHVDYETHKFICSVYESVIQAQIFMEQFLMGKMFEMFNTIKSPIDENQIEAFINEFHLLEKQLDIQNEYLDKHARKF